MQTELFLPLWISLNSQTIFYQQKLPYSQKIWRGIKFGGFRRNRQIKIRQNLYRMHVCMAILFQTAKFKSANTQFGGKPPNLMTANISGYTVFLHLVVHVAYCWSQSIGPEALHSYM